MNNDTTAGPVAPTSSIEKYRHHIAHLCLPYASETEMLLVLRSYLAGCIDRAFGHDPIQLAAGDRLQLYDEGRIPPMVASEPISDFNHDPSSSSDGGAEFGRRKR